MGIIDWWNRVLSKFRSEDSSPEPVMELEAHKAPEPVPERKTSDEMIILMAESGLGGSEADTDPAGEDADCQEDAGPFRDPVYWEADTDPVDEEAGCEAEGHDKKESKESKESDESGKSEESGKSDKSEGSDKSEKPE